MVDRAVGCEADAVREGEAGAQNFNFACRRDAQQLFLDVTATAEKDGAHEKPALYEIKDGKPNLINFQLENGVYIIPKVIDSGYLAIGKKKITFTRRG